MPNIWTHILFCEEVADAVTQTHLFSSHESLMKLGAQGPDPFFYYNFWPWKKNDTVEEIGLALHEKHCGVFLLDLIKAAKTMDDQVRAFIFGFVTHHILDRNTHPYINYRAGYEGNKHQQLEIIIDTLIMEKLNNLKTWKTPVYKEIDVGRSLSSQVIHLLHKMINKHYPELNIKKSGYIQKSYRDMKLALKILYDPYGWKNALLGSLVSSYSHRPVQANIDYLNENHITWYHPATNEPSKKSFIDLYLQAKTEGIGILTTVKDYWQQQDDTLFNKLKEQLGNISYDTGKSLELNMRNIYSDPIV